MTCIVWAMFLAWGSRPTGLIGASKCNASTPTGFADVMTKWEPWLECLATECEDANGTRTALAYDVCAHDCGTLSVNMTNCSLCVLAGGLGIEGAEDNQQLCPNKCNQCRQGTAPTSAPVEQMGREVEANAPSTWSWVGFSLFTVLGLATTAWLLLSNFVESGKDPLYRSKPIMVLTALGISFTAATMAMGQGLECFKVEYEASGQKGYGFSYDFWEGVDNMANYGAIFMAWFLAVTSGVWPFVKQLSVLASVLFGGRLCKRANAFRLIQLMGIVGKGAYADIGVVCAIVSVLDLNMRITAGIIDVPLTVGVSPRHGTTCLLVALLLSRCVSSWLLHIAVPERMYPSLFARSNKVDEPEQTQSGNDSTVEAGSAEPPNAASILGKFISPFLVDAMIWSFGALGLILTFVGIFCGIEFMEQTYHVAVNTEKLLSDPATAGVIKTAIGLTDVGDVYTTGHGQRPWTLINLILHGMRSDFAGMKGLRTTMSILTFILTIVFPMLQSLSLFLAMIANRYASQMTMTRFCHIVLLSFEWASLDVVIMCLLFVKDELPILLSNLEIYYQMDIPGLSLNLEATLEVDFTYKAGFWIAFVGVGCTDFAGLLFLIFKVGASRAQWKRPVTE